MITHTSDAIERYSHFARRAGDGRRLHFYYDGAGCVKILLFDAGTGDMLAGSNETGSDSGACGGVCLPGLTAIRHFRRRDDIRHSKKRIQRTGRSDAPDGGETPVGFHCGFYSSGGAFLTDSIGDREHLAALMRACSSPVDW